MKKVCQKLRSAKENILNGTKNVLCFFGIVIHGFRRYLEFKVAQHENGQNFRHKFKAI